MPDSIMYEPEETFVILETNQEECFLSRAELADKLRAVLSTLDEADLPPDLLAIAGIDARIESLIETSCQLDLGPDHFLQWYAVRLEK